MKIISAVAQSFAFMPENKLLWHRKGKEGKNRIFALREPTWLFVMRSK